MTATSTEPRRRTAPAFHSLRVASVEPLCPDAAAVTFEVPPELAAEFAFRPGQSLTLRRRVGGREHRRHYSICAPAGGPLRVGVREVPDGLFSSWLVHEVAPGDEIEAAAPSGSFCADPTGGGRHLLVAAGSGITPVLSIAASVLEGNPGAEATLVYGNRTSRTAMFAEELADLKNRFTDRFQLVHVLSREPRDADLLSGRLEPDRLRRLLEALVPLSRTDDVWLCGPYAMTEGARGVVADLGMPAERVHRELFHVDAPPPPPRRTEAAAPSEGTLTFVLDGSSSSAPIRAGASVLDSAQATRADLPFACRGGVCGTCRARVTAGEVEMRRNFALEDAEVAAGFVLTCQSHPTTAEVTVDYDA
ncbi:1,2-phenylacetyl-CoA epoxidase subunit PaaE [Streptomonospora wellingtoniae]|uniref:1,2-phenylacetyl-CoA epoxidase subunit PaaE n=1 Tax=Streptomonospora wellingtoniae TaxID=3075544 RepID=A0ABU2L107_9ACTN|nr:1,2-phenylacetyl-CoA epoxidase subunit PaaE [Streptomonospora sp. DSM 45055]MDT0305230.1 1,2-phenylacetyl-CoA epoxidase subunit PaaE [Streptomonospora sp. DSM 45055]